MVIEISPEDSIAHCLPAIGFRVATSEPGFFGQPFDSRGTYLNLFGPMGGRLSFCVDPAIEPESDAAAVEREVCRQLGEEVKYIRMAERGHIAIAGAARPAITYTRGAGIFGEAWCATLVGTPQGSLLVEVSIHWPGRAPPRCVDIAESRALRDLVQSFALLDPIGARGEDPRREIDIDAGGAEDAVGPSRCTPPSRDQLLALLPEGLMPAVFDVPQPSSGIGTTRLACAWQLESRGVPQDALQRCIRAWQLASDDLLPGALPHERLVSLDSELARETMDAPMLGRWMTALRGWATSTTALARVCEFLDDVRQIWWDLVSLEHEQEADRIGSKPPPAPPAPSLATTHEQLLTLDPELAMDIVFAPSGASREIDRVGIALVEQLRATNVPLEALELCMVAWSVALDGLVPGGPVPADWLATLDRSLDLQTFGYEVLARWMSAMRRRVSSAETLDAGLQFLFRARTTWALAEGLGTGKHPAGGEPTAA